MSILYLVALLLPLVAANDEVDAAATTYPSLPHRIPYRSSSRVARVQILVALLLGLSAFLAFSILRIRYPKIYVANFNNLNHNYLHSLTRQNLPRLPRTLLGWIPVVFKINEKQVLDHAGLDAVVFLGFFKMVIKVLTICVLFAVFIISPIRYKYTGRLDLPDDSDDDDGHNTTAIIKSSLLLGTRLLKHHDNDSYETFLWMYTIFTYVFTFIMAYFLFLQTIKIIEMRQTYLGKQSSITDRTIKLLGIPPMLRNEEDLKRHINSLGIGEVDSVLVVKEWNSLNDLFKLRKKILRSAEVYWVEYFEANGIKSKNDMMTSTIHPNVGIPININRDAGFYTDESDDLENQSDGHQTLGSARSRRSSYLDQVSEYVQAEADLPDDTSGHLPLLNDELSKRPKKRKGLFGLFGPKIDAINHCTERLEIIDNEIKRARQRIYPPSSTAFITMKSVAQAQMIAQAVLDPKINHLITNLAPAPHDIIWENLCLTRRERNFRIFFVTLFIGLLSILLIYPVRYLSNFLNTKSISKVWPKLGEFLKSNKTAESLVTGFLPPYVFTIFNIIMPYFYIWISKRQGYTSHSDEELSSVSKNFFYIFVNLFLVFTLFGTASLSDTTKIPNQLAESLKGLSLFYVDLIILQGLGIFPYKLILLGNLLKFSFGNLFWCKTPRDYLKLYKPPVFNFGLQLPQPILILVVTITYSVMSTKILTAGLVYFIVGYFVSKYQLLYACVHPPHSTGKVWPLVFRRVILGLLIFQLTMVGVLALEKAFVCASFLAPLPILTLGFLWNFQKNYIPLSIFIALRSIENNELPYHDDEEFVIDSAQSVSTSNTNRMRTLDERREFNQSYQYPHLVDDLDGPMIAIDENEILLVNSDGMTVRKDTPFFDERYEL
ncbi:DUF221-domain-containing protein [Hyphopichia burtonii NRRL Y-1933]|uniref:DUF221-domain-containing protein n=1 Tax=Hyphopichia burtonii NRRL Y-1933 TaxID=984485 RepID=A0A1E4RG01_9ASCO|nr:DUF221-domain-containing protein [Hyphopichia burtonii NRRL Y-1933]ODV66190.1 DUF221-domain-containing protein [Hyphopichia burtonii NRRL Y-1933]